MLLTAAIMMFSCASTPKALISGNDDNKKLTLKKGDLFEVRLEAQLSTGYSWQVTSIKGAEKKGGSKIETLDGQTTGGKEIQVLQFTATEQGEGSIILHYIQPWKGKTDTDKKFTVLLNIE